MTKVTFYDWALDARCYAVRLALSVIKIEHVSISVDPARQQAPSSGASQTHKPPLVVVDDQPISSVSAIMQILPRLISNPDSWNTGITDASILDWLGFSERALHVFSRIRNATLSSGLDTEPDTGEVISFLRTMEDHMTERQFDDKDWFSSDLPSVVDLALFPVFALSPDLSIEHDGYPALRSWMKRMRALPGFITVPGVPDYF